MTTYSQTSWTKKLKNVGNPSNLQALVWNLGSKRVLHFKYGVLDVTHVTHTELPQRNVLSLIMNTIYTAQFGDNLPPGCRITESADDACLFSSLVLLQAAIRTKEEGVNKVKETL
jgi:hypothetical protein